jgi:hypothetical protein
MQVDEGLDMLLGDSGGQGEIRTRGGFNPTPAFQASALNHYATCPVTSRRLGRGVSLAKPARDSNEIEWKDVSLPLQLSAQLRDSFREEKFLAAIANCRRDYTQPG